MTELLPDNLIDHRAVISDCGLYRWLLMREIAPLAPFLPIVFCMLNPSTADAERNDPTIRRDIGFASGWGASHLIVVNEFAYRATDPKQLRLAADPVGPLNDEAILRAARLARDNGGFVVVAWGAHGGYRNRDRDVLGMLRGEGVDVRALGLTQDGHPRHPLYLPRTATPERIAA